MAYNKAKAEAEWLRWKDDEEKQLRDQGVDEDTIQRLYAYDWAQFNKERQYRQRQVDDSEYITKQADRFSEPPIINAQALLDSIEDERLLRVLQEVDELTLKIVLLKMAGYTGPEIAKITGLKQMAINKRISRLRQKLKKLF